MDSSFLTINNEHLTLSESLTYLSNAGQFQRFTAEIVKEYFIEQELKTIENIDIETIEQFIVDFRLEQKLFKPGVFQQWLSNNHLTYASFRKQVHIRLKKQKLITQIAASKPSYFEENTSRFDTFILSRIVVKELEFAQNLKQQIENNADVDFYFNKIAKLHSIVDDKIIGGFMSPIIRQEIPDIVKPILDNTPEGQIIEPVEIDGRYCLLKIEKVIQAVLGGEIKQQLESEIFEQWIQEKINNAEIKLDFLEMLDN
ncbi:peptidylprolyl isomerase [Coleofasciculus chthonoplastes]|uniref:peptidylprolyl isomerase n=1 Tax=Coleofasciculus chthonoplastes TaxID=64178 RepID=UPI0032F3A123